MLRLLTIKSLDNLLFFLPLLAIHIFLSVSYSLVLHCSNSFEYSTDGVNGSEPLTTFVKFSTVEIRCKNMWKIGN